MNERNLQALAEIQQLLPADDDLDGTKLSRFGERAYTVFHGFTVFTSSGKSPVFLVATIKP